MPNAMTIPLTDVIRIGSPEQYKLHLACWNGKHQPLDLFVQDRSKWLEWNEWRGQKNDWTREKILSFIDFYPKNNAWLFGGIFSVVERRNDRYKLSPDVQYDKYVGRLIAGFQRYQGMRGRAFRLESHLGDFTVAEILPAVYSGESFPGFESIHHDFGMMEAIFRTGRSDWRAALENAKGVYLITDKETGKHYVGSAYGDAGIWSRWSCYIGTGHGWNDELVNLARDNPEYARKNFCFAVLELMVRATPDEVVLAREAHWKRVLMSRKHGNNRN